MSLYSFIELSLLEIVNVLRRIDQVVADMDEEGVGFEFEKSVLGNAML